MGSSLSPPLRNSSYFVMSSLPLRFLASWQAKQFSLRMGATSLMKLTGPLGACASEAGGTARAPAKRAQRTYKQRWERSMVGLHTGGIEPGAGRTEMIIGDGRG